MKRNDIYTHYKQKDYTYLGIAIPMDNMVMRIFEHCIVETMTVNDANTPDNEPINTLKVHVLGNSYMVEDDLPKVIYKRDGVIWARNVDDFYDFVEVEDKETGQKVVKKRFELKTK